MEQQTIISKLVEIEALGGLRILYACESGSRAWGFPSPDSDWDVRFIYVRPPNYYLSVAERKDESPFPIDDELDLYGWDLRKVLRLLARSNVTPFEWLQSPIVYREAAGFRDALWAVCPHYFSVRANVHHYLGIARGAMKSLREDGGIKIKKLFYVLRPLLAAKWCVERGSIAPMEIGPMMGLLPDHLAAMTQELIALKADAPEGFVIRPEQDLLRYIKDEIARCGAATADIEALHFDTAIVDDFFRKTLAQHDH